MPVILSLTQFEGVVVGAGPDGLFAFERGSLTPLPQPMRALYCCAVAGDRLLTGGLDFGVATRLITGDLFTSAEREWQGGWMDHTSAPVLALAHAPSAKGSESAVLLAATDGDGILRTANRGVTWSTVNFGLQEFVILSLAWAPAPSGVDWLDRQIAFAGSESGLYRSPAAGLAWKKVEVAPHDAVQAIAVSQGFHADGVVLLGTESSGIWRSVDSGRTFAALSGTPERIDALLATASGFLAGTPEGVLRSTDSAAWELIPNSPPALCLLEVDGKVYLGSEEGIAQLS